MVDGDEGSPSPSFEERLQRAISELEDALLGISDDEIRQELNNKGYVNLDRDALLSFKDQLKQASFHQLTEGNPKVSCDCNWREDRISAESDCESPSDFDVTTSSYLKIPIFQKLPSSSSSSCDAPPNDIPRICSDFNLGSENSGSDFPLEWLPSHECIYDNSIRIPSECNSFADDLIDSNPELPQPTRGENNTAGLDYPGAKGASRSSKNRTTPVTKGRNIVRSSHPLTTHSSADIGNVTIEQCVRQMCNAQMELINQLSGRQRNVWVPTKPRCSPLVRYQQYRKFWDRFPVPGTKPRKELIWSIRNRMARKEKPQKLSWWPEVKL